MDLSKTWYEFSWKARIQRVSLESGDYLRFEVSCYMDNTARKDHPVSLRSYEFYCSQMAWMVPKGTIISTAPCEFRCRDFFPLSSLILTPLILYLIPEKQAIRKYEEVGKSLVPLGSFLWEQNFLRERDGIQGVLRAWAWPAPGTERGRVAHDSH